MEAFIPEVIKDIVMNNEINPFQELYVTERATPSEYVRLFSPYLIEHASLLFQPGNVVIKGTQGSGKSTLLSLLKPEIRIAYQEAGKDFPVPQRLSRYISAGINLTRSDAVSIGQRPIVDSREKDSELFPLYFADFVNYWIVWDLLRTISFLIEESIDFKEDINKNRLDSFAAALSENDCWFGYLKRANSFASLKEKIAERIEIYRNFNQFNLKEMPIAINNSKTAVGQPISEAASCLKKSGVLASDVNVFIRIDQLEFLIESDELRNNLGHEYRRVINKALSMRDPAVSYKIGVRSYAWQEDTFIFRTTSTLEERRDFRSFDLDRELRRQENPVTWIFPDFARDVFTRRIAYSGYDIQVGDIEKSRKILRKVLTFKIKPSDQAETYAKGSGVEKALRIPGKWPEAWKKFLRELFDKDVLSAKLASAWVRQGKRKDGRLSSPPPSKPYPWEKTYWKKERIQLALIQLAAHCQQRVEWAGEDHVRALCGGHILIFVSVCQHIWDSFLRAEKGKSPDDRIDVLKDGIPPSAQSMGIQSASNYWYNKITERPGGHFRKRFVDILGRNFQDRLLDDIAMSYPGHNGFSLENDEIERNPDIANFLQMAENYGVLISSSHTTKLKNRKQRTKWYLNPIYSPHFRIHAAHVKEPLYVTADEVNRWMQEAREQICNTDATIICKPESDLYKEENSLPVQMGFDEIYWRD